MITITTLEKKVPHRTIWLQKSKPFLGFGFEGEDEEGSISVFVPEQELREKMHLLLVRFIMAHPLFIMISAMIQSEGMHGCTNMSKEYEKRCFFCSLLF